MNDSIRSCICSNACSTQFILIFSLKFFCINRLRLKIRPEVHPLKFFVMVLDCLCYCAIMRPLLVFAHRRTPCTLISVRHAPMGKPIPDICYGNPDAKAKKPSKPPFSITGRSNDMRNTRYNRSSQPLKHLEFVPELLFSLQKGMIKA